MKQILIHLSPLDRGAGVRRDIRVADGPSGESFGALGQSWEPAIVIRPQLSIELFNADLDGGISTGKAQFVLQLGNIKAIPSPDQLYWKGAPVTIWGDAAGQAGGGIEFRGHVNEANLDVDTGRLSIGAEVSDTLLDKSLLTRSFGGGTGIDGDAGKRGVLLPAGFGSVRNIEPVWFDLTRNIGIIDGYGNTVSIDWLGEGLNDFGAAVADYASYAALAAAIDAKEIKPGQWGKCTAEGLVGLGAPPVAPITVHAVFGANRAGALIRRICEVHAGIDPALIDADAFDAIDAAVDRAVNYWTGTDRNVKDLAEAVARSCNATVLISFQGMITITRATPSDPVLDLDRTGGGSPRVLDWRRGQVQAPYFQIRARTARPARVLRFDEVNFVDTIEDKGLYLGTESYRSGNIVWLSDGSQWLYINEAVTQGNSPAAVVPPATSNAYWQRLQPAKVASDFRYSTGQTIESLRPAEPGANVTETRTAAAIAGQGALATQNNVTYETQISGLPVALQPGELWGGEYIVSINTIYSTGATVEELRPAEAGANITESRTAAAIAGQGALATLNSADWATRVTGAGKPEDGATNDRGEDTRDDDFSPAYYRLYYLRRLRTEFKSAFTVSAPAGGYGTLETYASFANASGGPVWQRFTDGQGRRFIRYSTTDLAWGAWQPEYSGNRRPTFDGDLLEAQDGAEATLGNFKTPLGTAAAIAGQGALATLNSADWATRVSGAGKPEDNADVTATAQITFSIADIDIAADASGTITAGQLPRITVPVLMRGATSILTDAGTAYAVSGVSSNLAGYVSVSNAADATRGQITVAAGITGSGTFVLTATIGGVSYSRTVTVSVRRAAPPVGGGGGGSKSGSADLGGVPIGSTTFIEVVRFSGMTIASGETATARVSADYLLATNVAATNSVRAKWQSSVAGAGSWTDFGAALGGTDASFDPLSFDATPGSIAIIQTATPSAGTYDIRLVMAKNGFADIYIDNGFSGVTIA